MKFKTLLLLAILVFLNNAEIYCKEYPDKVSFNTMSTIETIDYLIIDVRSKTGIGEMILKGLSKYAGKKLIFRLHLNGLENFKLITKNLCFKFSISTSSGKTFQTLSDSPEGLELEISNEHSMSFQVTRNTCDKYYEIEIPPTVTQYFRKTIKIGWIDFYR